MIFLQVAAVLAVSALLYLIWRFREVMKKNEDKTVDEMAPVLKRHLTWISVMIIISAVLVILVFLLK